MGSEIAEHRDLRMFSTVREDGSQATKCRDRRPDGESSNRAVRAPPPRANDGPGVALRAKNVYPIEADGLRLPACVVGSTPAQARLRTQHIAAAVGLKGGSQPPPHVYVIASFLYLYGTDEVKGRDGRGLPGDVEITSVAYQWETYVRTTTQGSELTVLATFLVKPLELPTP
jgi:hypothetical protein